MENGWKAATAGALGGAALALIVVFGAAAAGLLPVRLSEASRADTVRGYLMAHPEVLAAANDRLQALEDERQRKANAAAIARLGMKRYFDPAVAFVTGPENAKATMVEFFDYNCPYCRMSLPAVKSFYAAHKGDTRFAFVEFPIKGQDSTAAARAAIAARRQPDKYLAFHFLLMSEADHISNEVLYADAKKAGLDIPKLIADMKDPAIDKAIDKALDLARKSGIDGTPTFIINGTMHPGAIDESELTKLTAPAKG